MLRLERPPNCRLTEARRLEPHSSPERTPGPVSPEGTPDLELLEELENKADIKAARKALKEKGGITLKNYKKKHGL